MNDTTQQTLRALDTNSDLLELLIEVQLAALAVDHYDAFVTLDAKLRRIRDERNGIVRYADGKTMARIGK